MWVTTKTVANVHMTLEDLRTAALVVLRLGNPDRKIESIKTLRGVTNDAVPVDEFGQPLTIIVALCGECADSQCEKTRRTSLPAFGLKECKDAIDFWYRDGKFVG